MSYGNFAEQKSRIRETKNLSTDADSSTAAKKLLRFYFVYPSRRRRQEAFGQKKKERKKKADYLKSDFFLMVEGLISVGPTPSS